MFNIVSLNMAESKQVTGLNDESASELVHDSSSDADSQLLVQPIQKEASTILNEPAQKSAQKAFIFNSAITNEANNIRNEMSCELVDNYIAKIESLNETVANSALLSSASKSNLQLEAPLKLGLAELNELNVDQLSEMNSQDILYENQEKLNESNVVNVLK